MTRLGKIFVLVNLVLSVLMAGWAIALFTNRVDWSTQTPSQDRSAGVVAKRKERIDQLWRSLLPTEATWKANRAELAKREMWRPLNQTWYAEELKKLETSMEPLRTVIYRNGTVALESKELGRPQVEDAKDWAGNPLKSLNVYTQEYNDAYQGILKERDEFVRLGKLHASLTKQLEGEKGLRQRLKDEQVKLEKLKEEEKAVKELEIKTQTDSERMVRRYQQLLKRVAELKSKDGD